MGIGFPFSRSFILNKNSLQARGLLSWYPIPLSPGGNKLYDIGGGRYDLFLIGTKPPISFAFADRMGASYSYAGVTQFFSGANRIPHPVQDFTISAWVTRQSTANMILASTGQYGWNNGYYIQVYSDNKIYVTSKTSQLVSPSAITNNVPLLITVTMNNWYCRLYLDGYEVNAGQLTGNLTSNEFHLGAYQDGSLLWNGLIGDARIYDRALSAPDVMHIYNPATRWDLYKPIMLQVVGGVSALITPDVVWGHDTGVIEPTVRDFSGNWSGTGAVVGSGDAEYLELNAGENMVSEVVDTGEYTVTLLQNNYDPSGDDVDMDYRHGATEAACLIAGWNNYTVPFTSLGYVQVRMTSTL